MTVDRPRQRALLAYLALSANQLVTVDGLIEAIWGAAAPATARAQVQADVSAIRRAFREAGAPNPVSTGRGMYRVMIPPDSVDIADFSRSVAMGRQADDPNTASRLLREALGLWRGPALADVVAAYVDGARAGLEEQRLAAHEQVAQVDLLLGRAAEVAVELAALVRLHPLRERLCSQLMIALYRSGRQADALGVARWLRRHLADELGLDPGPLIRQTEQMILHNDPGLEGSAVIPRPTPETRSSAPAAPVPAQLPSRVPGFVGRLDQIARLDALLPDDVTTGATTLVISALSGAGGIGKTTLAVWWAHRVAHLFPDGQLFVDLGGFSAGPPVRPLAVLGWFLSALGVPGDRIPVDEDSAAALYRSMLAGRRVLVVLDNAATAEQLRPLLPGEPGCLVLVTSRDRLSGLVATHGAHRVTLGVLRADEALDLLTRNAGADRVAAEPEAAADLARLCGYLPLAIQIAAAQLNDVPDKALAGYVGRLVAGGALRALAIGEDPKASIHATITTSYARLTPDEQRIFRFLGVVPGPDVTVEATAALAAQPAPVVESMLDRLVAVHLVDATTPNRYAMHDLVRQYAAERFQHEHVGDERERALARLFAWYLRTTDAAVDLLRPTIVRLPRDGSTGATRFPDAEQALAWLDAERANLIAAVTSAVHSGQPSAAWLLADALRGYLFIRPSMVEWLAVARGGLAAAEAEDDVQGQAAAQLSLAEAFWVHGRYDDATDHYTTALALSARAGWPQGRAAALNNLANVYARTGQLPEAARQYRRALAVRRGLRDSTGEALVLVNLGTVYHAMGQPRKAAEHQRRAVELYGPARVPHGEAMALTNLASALHSLGRFVEAEEHLTRALVMAREIGDRGVEAETLRALALVCRDTGRLSSALQFADAAMDTTRHTGDRRFEPDLLNTLGTIHGRLGQFDVALDHHRRALLASQQIGARGSEAEARTGMAISHTMLRQLDEAVACGQDAVALANKAGYRIIEGQAYVALATVALAAGEQDAAAEHARRAITIHKGTGHRLGEAQALALLGDANRSAARVARA
ncbi:MAG TPA: BTAD domain-containing putative transcriptional regulator [Asanoa sp.]|nr:BTAD domain-containing putative transcriptional regulator [Asanoa sp.]